MIAKLLILLALLAGAAFAEFEIVSGPGENSTRLVCNETWVAWENNTEPFYAQYVQYMTFHDVEINGTLQNITLQRDVIQVLDGSMPIIPVEYFEEGENGTRGRPVICRNPPTSKSVDDTALVVVIYITSSLGIIASLVALTTYMLFKRMRTLPGLVIMNLFLAFLLGGIMLQIRIGFEYHGMKHRILFAIWQGLLIARFAWMSLTGIEMCRSLYRGIRMIANSNTCHKWVTLTIYMLIGWGISIALATVMFVVELKADSTTVKRLFGGVGYLTNILPITVSQLINIGIVVFTSVIFCKAARRQKRLSRYSYNKHNINFIRLFLVVLTVLGLVWVMFFILVSIPDAVRPGVVITYAILTDTQPIFVCIAFICTPKVFRMYLVRFHIRSDEELSSKSSRTGTVILAVNERGIHGETPVTSPESERRLNHHSLLRTASVLQPTSTEKNEKSYNSSVSNDNGTVDNGSMAVDSTLVSKCHIRRAVEAEDKLTYEEAGRQREKEPGTCGVGNTEYLAVATQSNDHTLNHITPKSNFIPNGHNSLNPDRKETQV